MKPPVQQIYANKNEKCKKQNPKITRSKWTGGMAQAVEHKPGVQTSVPPINKQINK
jgi:hypothetical protein